MKKILDTDLDAYEKIIDPEYFKLYKQRLTAVRNPSWYSKKMLTEAAVYILASLNIASGMEDLKRRHSILEAKGTPLTEEQKKKDIKEMMTLEMTPWTTKVTKLAPILNPEFGDFLAHCEALWNYVEQRQKEKDEEGRDARKKDKLGYISCGLDRARLFTSVTALSVELRIQLLEAHVKPELRAEYHHPMALSEVETRVWLHQWSVWEQISDLSKSLLSKILEEIRPLVPKDRIERTKTEKEPGDVKLVEEDMRVQFTLYEKLVRQKFFRGMWDKAKTPVLRRRAKRLVYRFIVHQESVSGHEFWAYPTCMLSWATVGVGPQKVFSEYSMYPADGAEMPRELDRWEI